MNNKMKLLTTSCLFMMISCASLNKKNTEGFYEYKTEISKGRLILKDSIFEYNYEAPMLYLESKGTWFIKNNAICLKSNTNYKNDFIQVTESVSQRPNIIKIVDEDEIPLESVSLKLNNKLDFISDKNGEINLNGFNDIYKIEVYYIGLSKENNTYFVKNKDSKRITIKLIQKHETKRYFNNEKLKIDKNRIILDGQKYLKSSDNEMDGSVPD